MATVVWLGGYEPAVAQVQQAAMSGTWANTDTVTVTIGSKSVTHTLTTEGNTYSTILNNIATTLNASTIQEFSEVTWANSSNTHLQGTADTAGVPFVATIAESTAGDGEFGDFAETTLNKGPNCANTAENFTGGTKPVSGDTLVFENSDVDCKYMLQAYSGVDFDHLDIKQSFTGDLGLPRTNESGDTDYVEYRTRYFTNASNNCDIGEGEGSGSQRIMLDFGANDVKLTIHNSGTRVETGIPPILVKGTNSSNEFKCIKGDVGVAFFAGETANVSGKFDVGYKTNKAGDSTVICGDGLTFGNITQSGGKLELEDNVTTFTQYGGEATPRGAMTIGTLTCYGTIYDQSSGTFTTLTGTGKYDHTQSLTAKTITNVNLHRGAQYLDPHGVVTETNGIDLEQCSLDEVTIQKPKHKTITFTAVD